MKDHSKFSAVLNRLKRYIKPLPITLEVTPLIGCSNMCSYCPQEALIKRYSADHSGSTKIMTLQLFQQYIRSVPTSVQLNFTGYVEPFLNPHSLSIIQYAFQRGHSLMVNTTLEGLTSEIVSELRHINFDRGFNIHLPSGSFEEQIGAAYPREPFDPSQSPTALTLSSTYLDLLQSLIDTPLPNQTYHCHGSIHPQLLNIVDLTSVSVRGINTRASNLLLHKATPVPPERNIRGQCIRVNQNVLLPNGMISLCCQDYNLDEILGDLSRQTWNNYRSSQRFQNAQKKGCNLCDYCELGETHSDLHF